MNRNSLNSKFWKGFSIHPEIRSRLLKLSNDYIDFLRIDKEPKDVILVGSLGCIDRMRSEMIRLYDASLSLENSL